MLLFKRLCIILAVFSMISCGKTDSEKMIQQITQALQKELNDGVTITNETSVFASNTNNATNETIPFVSESSVAMMDTNTATTNIAMEEAPKQAEIQPLPATPIKMVAEKSNPADMDRTYTKSKVKTVKASKLRPATRARDLYVVQKDAYITVGNDTPRVNVSRKKATKITTAIFPISKAGTVDVYLYAIPKWSPKIRNNNTLIGYVKGLEFIQGHAQFTRYWNGRRANGQWMRLDKYNIYLEYHYKDSKGRLLGKEGRYWGGSHRNWYVQLKK